MAYLLDANVFIQAKNLHYGLDFCPAFWEWLIANNNSGKVFSIEKVVAPLHSRGKTYFGEVAAIETPDASTVVFKLNQPVPYFLRAFQPTESPLMPRHGFTEEEISQGKIRTAKNVAI